MELIFLSFVAGVLTVLAPCVFTVLPITIGGSLTNQSKFRPYIIAISLGISVFIFTLLIKASTLLIDIHPNFWKILSGGLLVALGIITVFPTLWDRISVAIGLQKVSGELLAKASTKEGILNPILTGAALGPVFSSCSPTYSLILATILPGSFFLGIVYLFFYTLGLVVIILMVALLGQKLTSKLKWAVNPKGAFKRIIGTLFIIIGLAVILGLDKKLETFILDRGFFNSTIIEIELLKR